MRGSLINKRQLLTLIVVTNNDLVKFLLLQVCSKEVADDITDDVVVDIESCSDKVNPRMHTLHDTLLGCG